MDLCALQRSQNLHVRVALPTGGLFGDELTRAGIEWVVFGYGSRYNLLTLWRLRRVIREFRPNLIHAHMPRSIDMVARVCRTIPLIATAHNIVKNINPFARCSAVICVSKQVRDSLVSLGFNANRAVVVHNAIKQNLPLRDTRAAARKEFGWTHDYIILCVARLVPAKGQIYAIQAMPSLLAVEPRLRLVFVGAGEEELTLKQTAKKLGVDARVVFWGASNEVPRLLNSADIYLQPSIKEGFCIAFLEAMSAGLPCIGTATGAIPEMIENSNLGILIQPADSAMIESSVLTLLRGPGKAMEMAARARAFTQQHFSQIKQGRETLAVYARVIPFDQINPGEGYGSE